MVGYHCLPSDSCRRLKLPWIRWAECAMVSAMHEGGSLTRKSGCPTVSRRLARLARIYTYDDRGRPTNVVIPDALSDSRLKTLLSFGRAQMRGLNLVTNTDGLHVELVSGRRIPLRRDGDVLHLDFLVPSDPSVSRPLHSTTLIDTQRCVHPPYPPTHLKQDLRLCMRCTAALCT